MHRVAPVSRVGDIIGELTVGVRGYVTNVKNAVRCLCMRIRQMIQSDTLGTNFENGNIASVKRRMDRLRGEKAIANIVNITKSTYIIVALMGSIFYDETKPLKMTKRKRGDQMVGYQ